MTNPQNLLQPDQTLAPNSKQSRLNWLETQGVNRLLRRLRLIKISSRTMIIITLLSAVVSGVHYIQTADPTSAMLLVTELAMVIGCSVSYFLVNHETKLRQSLPQLVAGGETELKTLINKYHLQANIAAFIIISLFTASISALQLSQRNESALTSAFIVVPTVAALLGLNRRNITIFIIITGILLAVTYSLANAVVNPNYYISLSAWLFSYAIAGISVIFFTSRMDEAISQEEAQSERLKTAVKVLDSTNQASAELGQQMSSVTAELNTTANDHFAISQEQVAAVTQVTSSLEELNETAQQIANSAGTAANETGRAVEVANDVRKASELAQMTSEEGAQAVEQTIVSVERVRNRIELLGQRLLNLTEQTRRVGTIIDIIDEIADETHLLALNASIEAAGGITTSGSNAHANAPVVSSSNVKSERFGVIAQEIKSLSDRSREATEEVRQAISEMQGAVAAAVLVAEEGKKETAASLSRSQIAGAVIGKLNEVIATSAQSAEQILDSIGVARERCEEISLATNQQKSANQQILLTMRNVTQASHESTGAITEFTSIIGRVRQQVDYLNETLTKANRNLYQSELVALAV